MFYTNMTPINFKANYLKTVYIPHKVSEGKTEMQETSIVELDTKDKNDMNTLAKTGFEWEKVASGFGMNIYNDAIKPKPYPDVTAEHYYALTTQNEDYKKLNSNKILGLAAFFEKNDSEDELVWLQVNPKENTENARHSREFKGVGRAIIDYLKTIAEKPIYTQADNKAIPFYEKQGFEQKNNAANGILIWNA